MVYKKWHFKPQRLKDKIVVKNLKLSFLNFATYSKILYRNVDKIMIDRKW